VIRRASEGLLSAALALALALACARTGPSVRAASPAPTGARAPESLEPAALAGVDPHALARVDTIIEAAIADHATPGAALAIGRRGGIVRMKGYGRLDYVADAPPATDSTLYDLASLTKVIGTTTAVMIAVEQGKLDLDRSVASYLPEWSGADRRAVTVRDLMLHHAGLPAFLAFWRDQRGREAYVRAIAATPLEYAPGTRTVYSDLGLILTGVIVERQLRAPLDVLLQKRVFGPLGMRDTRYNPLARAPIPPDTDCTAAYRPGAPLLARIAPTEVDTIYRNRHVHGIVHDENACAIGGVSGHAGLFSSARDLAVFASLLLNGGSYGQTRILRPETIKLFTTRASPASSRALGWDTPGPGSSLPPGFSDHAFGHTGFTGTSIWLDPERDLFVVLLTNRVDPTRDNPKIGPLRREVARAVQEAVTP
jgi:CubicO group peptidase (beta-lactamase class C family)